MGLGSKYARKEQPEEVESVEVKVSQVKKELIEVPIEIKAPEITNTVKLKPIKVSVKKIVSKKEIPVVLIEKKHRYATVTISGYAVELKEFRSIIKEKGFIMQQVLIKLLNEWNKKNK